MRCGSAGLERIATLSAKPLRSTVNSSSNRSDAHAVYFSDCCGFGGTLGLDVDLARIEGWLAADDGAAGQRFFRVHRAIETERLDPTGAGEYRRHHRRLASTISGLKAAHRRESHSRDQRQDW